ncbi:BrnT family toxin [Testudinibacter sp. P80/BLE/0925]|uniref:BrnT family toxin n=1 Tax=Testudinibacter sp. TW-1 TaxID=3417757 RepID=UPI003D36AF35
MAGIEYDQLKRQKTLLERGLDFAHAEQVFHGTHFTAEDSRQNYGEIRYITIGTLAERLVVIVWTWRDKNRRIISMRKANEREQQRFTSYLD